MAFTMDAEGRVLNPSTQKTIDAINAFLEAGGAASRVASAGDGMNAVVLNPDGTPVGGSIKNAQWLLAKLNDANNYKISSDIWRQFPKMPSDWVQGKINQHKHATARARQAAEARQQAYRDAGDIEAATAVHLPTNLLSVTDTGDAQAQAVEHLEPPSDVDQGPGASGASGDPFEELRNLIDMGADPTLSIWEEMNRTGMVGNPFQDTMESYLKSQVPQFIGAGMMQSLRGQPVTGIGDYLSQSYGGGASPMSPEDLSMIISGQPGEGINASQFAQAMDALDQEKNRSTAFNLAFGASPLSNAPLAIRNPAASQMNNLWQGYRSGIAQEDIEDVKGQADFLRYAASKMGIG